MTFASISLLSGSGGIAPSYEKFGPILREQLDADEVSYVEDLLLESNFCDLETSPFIKAMRDVALSSITVRYSDGSEKTYKYHGELDGALDRLVKFVQRRQLES